MLTVLGVGCTGICVGICYGICVVLAGLTWLTGYFK